MDKTRQITDSCSCRLAPKYVPYTQNVSVETADEWGKELLKDPKVTVTLQRYPRPC